MAKNLQVGNQIFQYPETGDNNWSEEATGWAEAVTEVLETVQGAEDILKTESSLVNGSSGDIAGLVFDTGAVQQVIVKGYITRTYTVVSGKPTEVESIVIEGAYNGSEFKIAPEYVGDDTGVVIDAANTGQFTYVAEDKTDTLTLTIVFEAKAITV